MNRGQHNTRQGLASSLDRRTLLLGSVALLGVGGCAAVDWPKPSIPGEIPSGLRPILAPAAPGTRAGKPAYVIDVHAHFFNARDVPVYGYLSGPVAHSRGGIAEKLLRALAGVADWLAGAAPSAKEEFDDLIKRAGGASIAATSKVDLAQQHQLARRDHLALKSKQFYEAVQRDAPDFVSLYNEEATKARLFDDNDENATTPLNETSLFNAMVQDDRKSRKTVQSFVEGRAPEYAQGVLAFVGYMLSFRWMNLIAYQQSYTTDDNAFGVQQVLGALVDFDYWLTPPPPRTAQEDQIKLHQLLSILSAGYMRPLVAYNPWKDARDGGATRERVLRAIKDRGFVGAKMYPPNGYRPYGNVAMPLPANRRLPGMPADADLDQALLATWRELGKLDAPMMAHTGHTMGKDDDFDDMASPKGYKALLAAMGTATPARVQLGHFGGDADQFPWSGELAALMETPGGSAVYGDLGYWDTLRCPKGVSNCASANRLKQALKDHPALAQRLMYGSDWLMLSQERRWDRYPFDILAATKGAIDADALFAGNARRCYPRLLAPTY